MRLTVPVERPRRRMPEPRISVLLVDDHSLVRRGFRRMLEDDPDIAVVGEAERRSRGRGSSPPSCGPPWW